MKRNLLRKNTSNINYSYIIIPIIVAIGIIIRIKGLGKWPLALDEYYIIKSSEFILEHGLPQFPNGGYYVRGILLQYLIAPFLAIGVKAEFIGRFYSVLCNIITIPAIYLIAKRLKSQVLPVIVIVIFCFSIWEIEFSRFARMYSPFQAIFTWYIYFTLKDYLDSNFEYYKYLLILSSISFLVYEGSIFLAVFNFIPFIVYKKIDIKLFIWASIILIISTFFNLFDFRTLYSNPILPPEYIATIKANWANSPIKIPQILLYYALSKNFIMSILTTILFAINIFLGIKIYKTLDIKKSFGDAFSIFILTSLAFLNQFGLFFTTFIIVVFGRILNFYYKNKASLIYFSILGSANFIFWSLFGLFTKEWYTLFNNFESYNFWGISKKLLIMFFNYPDNYYTLFNYFRTIPFLTLINLVLISFLIIRLLVIKNKLDIKYLVSLLIFFFLFAAVPTLLYEETRYTFFLAPIIMIVVSYSIYDLSSLFFKNKKILANISFVIISLIILISSKDFNIKHLANIDSQEVNYRMIYKNNYFKRHLYRRWDIKTPTEYVFNNADPNDIIMCNENSHEYYLPKLDYFNFDYTHKAFVTMSVEEGKKERWSNANMINNNAELEKLLNERDKNLWFLVYPEHYLNKIDFYGKYNDYLVCEGIDKMIKVYKFPKNR